jgi:hypothetical protein
MSRDCNTRGRRQKLNSIRVYLRENLTAQRPITKHDYIEVHRNN